MRYANIIYNDTANVDSGVSLSIYTQGCTHHCRGCFQPSTWDFYGGKEWTKEDENSLIYCLKNYKYDWLTLLGGEPMDNLSTCWYFLSLVKKYQPNIKVWCYSGYTKEQIENDKNKKELLDQIDVLVDGEFKQELYNPKLKFMGSSNQKLWRLK